MGMSPLPPPMGPYDRGAPPTSPRRRVKARQLVCEVFDRSARGQGKSGPLVLENGDANVPSVVRKLGSVAAVEHALTPPTPSEVAAAAHRYIDAQLDLVTAAMAYVAPDPIDEVNRLTAAANDATKAFGETCGLPR